MELYEKALVLQKQYKNPWRPLHWRLPLADEFDEILMGLTESHEESIAWRIIQAKKKYGGRTILGIQFIIEYQVSIVAPDGISREILRSGRTAIFIKK